MVPSYRTHRSQYREIGPPIGATPRRPPSLRFAHRGVARAASVFVLCGHRLAASFIDLYVIYGCVFLYSM